MTFRALQAACGGVSPSVLNNRLKLLEEKRLAGKRETGGYGLTEQGEALIELQRPLAHWARGWQESLRS
jgi:DNA-binding HxlR family transcriptional regulator